MGFGYALKWEWETLDVCQLISEGGDNDEGGICDRDSPEETSVMFHLWFLTSLGREVRR